ncbi:two-component sensor histidine kinase [Erythrobacter sp. KY5]|nr:two-component sensor histidine kinase [Erythrobacter sp. KY5]
MVSVALALLTAQAVSVVLLYRAGEERRETAAITSAAFRLVNGAEREARREARRAAQEEFASITGDRGPRRLRSPESVGGDIGFLPRPLRFFVSAEPPIPLSSEEGAREERLRAVLGNEGIEPHAVAIAVVKAGDDPQLVRFVRSRPRLSTTQGWRERRVLTVAIQREAGGIWEAARVIEPPRPANALGVLVFQTLVTFAFLLVVLFLVLRRITRPLALLTDRVSTFSKKPDQPVRLEETGPADTRRLIAAHNQMEARIAALLDEKDVMLGAIGHDLKTPLAALRVRIENVPDDAQREKMAASIEDITATLDDILSLARMGRSGALEVEAVDLGMLAIGVAEEFEDLGEPVTMLNPPRVVARVQVTWIKRALRNLVSNALRYGGDAELSVEIDGNTAVLAVEDRGPGIEEARIAEMMEPFTRGEASRNRATGGAGLGLTLARAIAQQHGGELVLANRNSGGLRAELRLPL